MDKTPKSKIFGFKRGAASVERSPSSNKNTVSKDEVIDLETLPLSGTTIQTSPMPAVSRINAANQLFAEQSSPQFIVGWKDGAESNDMDMNSPVRSLPIHRKIRRFPEGHVFKAPKNKQRDNREDILECIDWAKNLFESTSREKDLPADENKVTETNDAIILDDSVDEIMVLCSQAVEDNLPISMQPPVIPVTSGIGENHPKPSDLHDCRTKRLKMDDTVPVESTIKKDIYSSQVKSAATRQELKTDDTVILQSNNNVEKKELSNFKPPFTMSHDKAHSRQDIKSINPVTPVRFPTKTTHKSAAQPEDLFQSILNDDEDALFGSFDFHTIDKIQNTQSKSSSLKSINSRSNILAPKLNELKSSSSKPITKEMRDQIERRRLEAKRRLLLNKKHKSL